MPRNSNVPIDLRRMDLMEMLQCSREVRNATAGATSIEECAQMAVRYFYNTLRNRDDGSRQCVLARFYRTMPFSALEPERQTFASRLMPSGIAPFRDMKCLTLLATCGDRPEWNEPRLSRGHQAIPLPSAEVVERAPMIARLIQQLGVDVNAIVDPSGESTAEVGGRNYNVFYVQNAADSPFIPAQDFVREHEIHTVIGFGGLVEAELFSVILFTNVNVPRASADRFRNIALDVKGLLLPLRDRPVFATA